MRRGDTAANLAVVVKGGRRANLEVGPPPFLGASLSGIAGAKDLVGGAEDALGGTLGECLALAP